MAETVGKIIVVDDEVELKNALVDALTSQSFEVRGFTSGREALAVLREEEFDVLLSDLMMPEMDGISLVKAALEIDPHLFAIIMTGQGTIQTAVDAMKAGTFDYVLKPFRLKAVMPVLTRAINARRLRLENLQLRETVAIYELSQTIAFTLNSQTIISKLADAALQQTDADEVSVLLPVGDGSDELYVAAVRGENRQRLLGEHVPLEETISGWVVRQREALLLKGEVNDERFRALWPHPEIRSAISIPMQVANKLVGTININTINRARPFTLGQMKALTILASTAAAALESASLYAEVQKAEERYRSIFENALDGIFQATPDATRFFSVNPVMAQMFGYESPEEMVQTVEDVTKQLGLDPARRDEALVLLKKDGLLENFETHVRRKDRAQIWTSANVRAVRNAEGELTCLDGIIQDITERKRAEEALRASEAEMRALFASMTDVIIVFDDQGRHLKIAPTKTPHLYKPAAGRIGKTLHEIFPKEKADFFLAQIRIALEKGRTHRVEYSLSIDDREFWYDGSISPMTANSVIWVARDITERKEAEHEKANLAAEIENQRRRLDSIISSVPGVVWEAWGQPDAATQRIDFVSDYVEAMLGYSVEEWLSTPNFWLQIVHPDDREEAGRVAAANFVSGKSSTVEFRWVAKDGRAIWVESNYVVIPDAQGQPGGVRGVTIDTTERKRVEEALRETARSKAESLALLDTTVSSAPVGFAFHNCELVFERINETLAAINGLPVEEHIGRTLHEVLPEMAPIIEPLLQRVLDTGEPVIDFELNGETRADPGHKHYWVASFYPVRMQRGEILGVGVLVSDVTARKQAEQALRESEERYRDLVENAHDIIYSHDLNGRYTSINKAGEQITGYTREEAAHLTLAQTVAPEYLDRAKEMLARKLAGEKITAYELEILAKDGRRIAVEANTKLVYQDGTPAGVQGIARDVTARKQLEDQLRQSQKMEAIGQLAGGVAHDFNNLLTAINGYSSLALQRLDDGHPVKSYLEEVKKAGDRAANLTRQLLAFGRKQILQPLAVNLNDIVTEMNKMLRRLIGEDIRLTAKLDLDLKRIKADPGQIEQVLVNLVVNARDAMPTGGNLTIETANVQLSQEYVSHHLGIASGNYVMLAVSDTGFGMNEETRARIFEPFFTTKEKGKGTGLGLSTVYGIVKQSGGNIWVYSEPNQGTSFKVYLPQLDMPAPHEKKTAVEETMPRGTETVLLVEDEDIVRGLARNILEGAGYSVLSAQSGEEAVQLCANHQEPIHLLLTDVIMPEASGKEVADRVGLLVPKLKVLYMSGYTDESIVHHGVLDSNVEFIQKPFTPLALSKKVREVLDGADLLT